MVSHKETTMTNQATRRTPQQVMRLSRLGSFHQSRLSFMRILLRRIQQEQWRFSRPTFSFDSIGVGYAVYAAHTPERTYSLIVFGHDLPAEKRSDRVIADAWDATFTLFDGVPTAADIERLAANVPLQEAGRVSEKELTLSRANRSERIWEAVITALAQGQQPSLSLLKSVGYLMRTTAVYGSGKFGAADYQKNADRPECSAPFQLEMLSVYLVRCYARDLVEYLAHVRGGEQATRLSEDNAQALGIGNSTGLGMAPFLINHPILFNHWIMARENAICSVRNIEHASDTEVACFMQLLQRSIALVNDWHSAHPQQKEKIALLRLDMQRLTQHLTTIDFSEDCPWNRLYQWVEEHLCVEAQELIASLLLEPYGHLVDQLAASLATDNHTHIIDGSMTLADLKSIIRREYDWALAIDWTHPDNIARVWYVSEEKLEPRLGERFSEDIADYEQPLAPARDVGQLYITIEQLPGDGTVADFLFSQPTFRSTIRRIQRLTKHPFAEIRDNTISASMLPIDMLRCKLSFFGATHFDPKSDRWVRISMYQNAPYPHQLQHSNTDYWPYPQTPMS